MGNLNIEGPCLSLSYYSSRGQVSRHRSPWPWTHHDLGSLQALQMSLPYLRCPLSAHPDMGLVPLLPPPWGWFPCFLLQEAFRILSGGLKLLHPLMWVVWAHGLFCLLTSMWWSSKWAPCFSFQHLLQHPGRKRLEFPPSEHPRSVFQCSVGITPPRAPGAGGVELGRPQMSCSPPGHCTGLVAIQANPGYH